MFKDCFVGDMEERLESGKLDLVIGVLVPRKSGRSRVTFYEEPLRYVPPNHEPWASDIARLEDVCRSQILMPVNACGLAQTIEALLDGRDASIYPGRAMTYGVLAEWAELGIGGALLPSRTVPTNQRFPVVEHHGVPVILNHEAVWQRTQTRPHIRAVIQHFQQRVPSLVKGSATASRPG